MWKNQVPQHNNCGTGFRLFHCIFDNIAYRHILTLDVCREINFIAVSGLISKIAIAKFVLCVSVEHLLSVLIYHPAEVRITCDFGTCDGVAFIYRYCNGIVYFYLAFLLFVPRKEIEFLAVYLNICGTVFFIAVCLIAEK